MDNSHLYLRKARLSASDRRVLITKWVSEAWREVSSNRDMIVRSFQKCGISVAIDGSEDHLICIEGLGNYRVNPYPVDNSDTEQENN